MAADDATTRTFLSASVERFADWVKYEDAKAGGVAVVTTLAATDLMGHVQEAAKVGISKAWIFWLAVVSVAATALAIVWVWWPRTATEGTPTIYFWGKVACMSEPDYRAAAQDHKNIDEALSSQAWELATIMKEKSHRVKLAMASALILVVLWLAGRFAMSL